MPVKIMNSKELNIFLKVLAEESVRNAYDSEISTSFSLFEADEEDPLFGGDEEKGDEKDAGGGDTGGDAGGDDSGDALADLGADTGGDAGGDAGAAETPPEAPPQEPKKDKVNVRPTPLTLELGEVTSDGLISTLNMIRAGRSLKEPDVSAELEKYINKQLNDSERLALATFLSALRDLTSGTPAEDAPEPGDENVDISANDEEREEHGEVRPREPSRPALQPSAQPANSIRVSRGTEDTTPPIQVGPRNNRLSEEYRKHILSILIG